MTRKRVILVAFLAYLWGRTDQWAFQRGWNHGS